MKQIVFIVIFMFICFIAFGQDHSDTAINQENNVNLNDQILRYQEFLREETKLHREYTQEYYTMILYILSGLGVSIGIVLTWLNWKSKKDIKEQVNQQFRETFEGIINKKVSQLNEKIDQVDSLNEKIIQADSLINANKEKAAKQFKEINKMILELSEKSNKISKQTDKNFEKDEQTNAANLRGKKILWVDDYPSNNNYPREILEQAGIKFSLARDTSQAVNILKKEQFDLIISDMGRGENPSAGVELLTKLKSLKINTPTIIFSSTHALGKFGSDALELGASACTTKITDLLNNVQKILNEK